MTYTPTALISSPIALVYLGKNITHCYKYLQSALDEFDTLKIEQDTENKDKYSYIKCELLSIKEKLNNIDYYLEEAFTKKE